MKQTGAMRSRRSAIWMVRVLSIGALVLMLSNQTSAQRSRPSRMANNPKVRVGEFPPDFELPKLTFQTDAEGKTVGVISDNDTIRLSSFRGKKPVCMIMSSYT